MSTPCTCGHAEDEHNGPGGSCDECDCEFYDPESTPEEAKVVFD